MDRIVQAAEDFFGEEVERVSAPGGEGRASYRLHFEDRDIIATLRPNFRRTHLEAHVLRELSAHSQDLPRVLGVDGEILFQSDVGRRRLNQLAARSAPDRQLELAAEAVAAIFRIHSAARKTGLNGMMPHLGANDAWIANFVNAVDALQPYSQGIPEEFDRAAVSEAVRQPGRQFIKWDCRSGNAAIGPDDRLRWFDFEYSGLRHGAEDFAWLIGDEAWPVAPDQMADVMIDAFDPGCGHAIADYLEYMSLYTALHCVQRFKLIVKEARKRGWLSKQKVLKYDDAGVHPDFAVQICRTGRYYAAQSRLTAPLARNFDGALQAFKEMSGGAGQKIPA